MSSTPRRCVALGAFGERRAADVFAAANGSAARPSPRRSSTGCRSPRPRPLQAPRSSGSDVATFGIGEPPRPRRAHDVRQDNLVPARPLLRRRAGLRRRPRRRDRRGRPAAAAPRRARDPLLRGPCRRAAERPHRRAGPAPGRLAVDAGQRLEVKAALATAAAPSSTEPAAAGGAEPAGRPSDLGAGDRSSCQRHATTSRRPASTSNPRRTRGLGRTCAYGEPCGRRRSRARATGPPEQDQRLPRLTASTRAGSSRPHATRAAGHCTPARSPGRVRVVRTRSERPRRTASPSGRGSRAAGHASGQESTRVATRCGPAGGGPAAGSRRSAAGGLRPCLGRSSWTWAPGPPRGRGESTSRLGWPGCRRGRGPAAPARRPGGPGASTASATGSGRWIQSASGPSTSRPSIRTGWPGLPTTVAFGGTSVIHDAAGLRPWHRR